MKKAQIVLLLGFFFPLKIWSQIGGQSTYQFLTVLNAPRQVALGGKNVTIFDEDVNQVFYNPAAINVAMHQQLSVNYNQELGIINHGMAGYAYTYDRHIQSFFVGVNYFNYGRFEGYDEDGNATANFTGNDFVLQGAYSYNIPKTPLQVGVSLKFISSTLANYQSYGVAADLGFIYTDVYNEINYGLVIKNIGKQITTYAGTNEKLPLEIQAGVSQKMQNVPLRWHVTLENLQRWKTGFSNPTRAQNQLDGTEIPEKISFFNQALQHVIIGAELFPEHLFSIRLGYNFRRSQELKILEKRSFSGLSAGFGFLMNRIHFDYAYTRLSVQNQTHSFGILINLE